MITQHTRPNAKTPGTQVCVSSPIHLMYSAALLAPGVAAGCHNSNSQSAGYQHTCAIFVGGGVKCWGRGAEGRLGYDSTDDKGDAAGDMAGLGTVNLGASAIAIVAVLATGDARVATSTSLRGGCFMLHSVVHAVSAEMLRNVLLEAAELRKLESHPSLLRLCAVVTDQPWGEVGLLSELTTGSLATLLDTSPVELTWANGLLSLATDVAKGLAHLHGLGL